MSSGRTDSQGFEDPTASLPLAFLPIFPEPGLQTAKMWLPVVKENLLTRHGHVRDVMPKNVNILKNQA